MMKMNKDLAAGFLYRDFAVYILLQQDGCKRRKNTYSTLLQQMQPSLVWRVFLEVVLFSLEKRAYRAGAHVVKGVSLKRWWWLYLYCLQLTFSL